jgi:hypothetical protein
MVKRLATRRQRSAPSSRSGRVATRRSPTRSRWPSGNVTAFGSGDPAISLDGRTIVLPSDRPGGAGAGDLYESTRACQ